MKQTIPDTYTIQKWLFDEAEGRFDIDLAESGIQYHHVNDLTIDYNYDLNYSLDRGKLELRKAIAEMYSVSEDNIAITNGAQEALYLFYRIFLSDKDHIITFTPGWQQSWEIPHITGAEVTKIRLRAEENYRLNIDTIKNSIKSNTKLIIFSNPNNPTGVLLSESELLELTQLCEKNNIFMVADEEYFTDYQNSLIKKVKHSCIVGSLSKVYGFPGLRLGWLISDQKNIEAVVNYKRYVSVSNSSLCEYLGIKILSNYKVHLTHYANLVSEGYNILRNWIADFPILDITQPEGTPFAYIKLSNNINSYQFCRSLLKNQKVLLMPAEVFEDEFAIRVSFGREKNILMPGLAKVALELTDTNID